MKKGNILVIILLIIIIGLISYIIYDKLTINNEPSKSVVSKENSSTKKKKEEVINNEEKSVDINNLDNNKVNDLIKEQLLILAKQSELQPNYKLAEVHIILGKYIKDDVAYYELYSEYGTFEKVGDKINMKSGSSSPVLIGITKDYDVSTVEVPKDGSEYGPSLEKMFEEDAFNVASDNDEIRKRLDEVYLIQLNEYFKE